MQQDCPTCDRPAEPHDTLFVDKWNPGNGHHTECVGLKFACECGCKWETNLDGYGCFITDNSECPACRGLNNECFRCLGAGHVETLTDLEQIAMQNIALNVEEVR